MTEMTTRENILGQAPVGRLLARFAVPSVLSLLVNALYNIVDQIFIGQGVGYLGNAATNVVFPMTVIVLAFALLIGDGSASYLSLRMGAGEKSAAQKGVNNGFVMLLVAGGAFLLVGFVFMQPLARVSGATDSVMPYALSYGRIIALGYPMVIVGTGLNSILRAAGSPKAAMLSMLAGAAVNTILDPIFIFVCGWGVEGAALATVLGQGLSCAVTLVLAKRMTAVRLCRRDMRPQLRLWKRIAGLGMSSFITQVAMTASMLVINNVLVRWGALSAYGAEIPLAALGIVMKVNQILVSCVVGVAIGAQPIVGYNYGAGNLARVKKTYLTATGISLCVAVCALAVFQLCPQTIINLFGQESALYNEFAQKCFRIFLLLCPFGAFQQGAGVFFQAIGKPVKAAVITMSRQILALIPAVLLLPGLLGLDGVLWAGPLADTTAFLFALGLILAEMHGLNRGIRAGKAADVQAKPAAGVA